MSDFDFSYKIPKEIKDSIPDYFYFALAGELTSIFGPIIWEEASLDTSILSTSGWYVAFNATCTKLRLKFLSEYYESLEWIESDCFDSEIFDEVDKIKWSRTEHQNPYFVHLL